MQKSFQYTSFECQLLTVSIGQAGVADGITIAIVYRPPSTSTTLFYEELSDMLTRLSDVIDGDRFIACGDFNCGGDDSNSIRSDLESVFDLHCLHQHVPRATRGRSSSSEALLDLVVARLGSNRISQLDVHSTHEVSDHDLITWSLATRSLPPRKIINFYHRNLKNLDTDRFQNDIRESCVFSDPADTVDGFAEQLESTVGEILERHCPLRKRTKFASARRDSRWLNDEANEAKRERRRLERRWKATKSESDRITYRKYCRIANKKITNAREQFYKDRIKAAESDPRRRWSEIRNVLHKTSSTEVLPPDECQQRCDRFIEFFVNKVRVAKQAVSEKVNGLIGGRVDPLYQDKAHVGQALTDLNPPTVDEVKKMLSSISAKSSNMDAIPTSLLKSCPDVFAPLIARLAALSFRDGMFPSRFKTASVTPLLKKPGLDSEVPGNFRPISNLNNISKILERLFLRGIIEHVNSSPNFNSSQSAYRKGHSTETALNRLLNDIYCAADGRSRSLLILLDLSAAFDTLDIDTLIRRLQWTFGINGSALDWIRSYLTGRLQFVRVGEKRSDKVTCEFGVPQGSVLGPILFTLYVAPVANVIASHGVCHLQYADDTQLYIALKDEDSIVKLQNCADDVYNWFAQNGLSLNPEKSEAILLGTGARLRQEQPISSISIAGSDVDIRDSVRSLGVTIDSGLTFNQHVDYICKTSAYHIRSLRHIRKFIDTDAAMSVATALVGARVDYCNSLLYGTSKRNIDKLQRLQNSLARAVTGTGASEHITPVLKKLHWLPITARIHYKIALLTYKVISTQQPAYLAGLIRRYQPTRTLRPSSRRVLDSDTPRTMFASRAFCFAAPKIWNELPKTLSENQLTLPNFKRDLKTFLFQQYFLN